ncbi:MAG TPA: sialate O-acetylesterase, partial [Phenylobacterium sp.]|nr:sialate O-acetylesterase [Phenylobacterium sp.]
MSELVVLAGQSNADVFGVTAADLPAGYYTPSPLVQVWVAGVGFQELVPGVNSGGVNTPSAVGPEVAIAHDWLANDPGQTLYIVKSVRGSTGLEPGAAPNWSPEQPAQPDGAPNGMFNKTTALVDQAKAVTGLPVATVYWMEGETPATDAAQASAFQADTQDVFAHMRADWGAGDIVFGEVSAASGFAFGDEVRAAQTAIAAADPRTLLVDIDALPLQADDLHLTAP